MSKKKPIGNKTVNQQEIESINIDVPNGVVQVIIKFSNERSDGTRTVHKNVIRTTKNFSQIELEPQVQSLIDEIDTKV